MPTAKHIIREPDRRQSSRQIQRTHNASKRSAQDEEPKACRVVVDYTPPPPPVSSTNITQKSCFGQNEVIHDIRRKYLLPPPRLVASHSARQQMKQKQQSVRSSNKYLPSWEMFHRQNLFREKIQHPNTILDSNSTKISPLHALANIAEVADNTTKSISIHEKEMAKCDDTTKTFIPLVDPKSFIGLGRKQMEHLKRIQLQQVASAQKQQMYEGHALTHASLNHALATQQEGITGNSSKIGLVLDCNYLPNFQNGLDHPLLSSGVHANSNGMNLFNNALPSSLQLDERFGSLNHRTESFQSKFVIKTPPTDGAAGVSDLDGGNKPFRLNEQISQALKNYDSRQVSTLISGQNYNQEMPLKKRKMIEKGSITPVNKFYTQV